MNPRLAPHNIRPLRRARTLAALAELDVAVCFDWRGFECFRARPFDWALDHPGLDRPVIVNPEDLTAHWSEYTITEAA